MNLPSVVVLSICTLLWASPISYAQEEYTGTLESRPTGTAGSWVIGGRTVEATDKTQLEPEHGPIVVGGCVVVEYQGTRVAAIKSEEKAKCRK
jgi:hypothetical protein